MKTVKMQSGQIQGMTGKLAGNLTKNWLIGLRETNPAILDMFKERDHLPYRDLLAWSGEFAGKYITGAYYTYRLTLDQELYAYICTFLDELLTYQDEGGYLGCFCNQCQLTEEFNRRSEVCSGSWDAWGHYHIMYGLLLWYIETGKKCYLDCVERIAGLFLRKFYQRGMNERRLVDIGTAEANLAPIHSFAILYSITGKSCYLNFALEVERDLSDERAGDYITRILNGSEYYQCPNPRWERIHTILGLAELYRITGKEYYFQTVKRVYDSIQRTDIHNTGAFSTDEQAVGTPFRNEGIETCCVIAYNALAVEVFKLTGDSKVIDFLERAHYNACMGAWSPTGRWSTYHTPMDGERQANFHAIGFQCRAGSPELNCCSVNAARAVGMLSEWAVTRDDTTLYINSYEDVQLITEDEIFIQVRGGYPACGKVYIEIRNYQGELAIRIPEWSTATVLKVNGADCTVMPGTYYRFVCTGESILELHLDFTTRYLMGGGEFAGMVSIFRGPVLYGVDIQLIGSYSLTELPVLSAEELKDVPSVMQDERILIPLKCGITLGDFYHLGMSGSQYRTWLQVK